MNEKMNSILAGSCSLVPELRALLIRYAAPDLLIDQEAVEGGDPHALANAKLVPGRIKDRQGSRRGVPRRCSRGEERALRGARLIDDCLLVRRPRVTMA